MRGKESKSFSFSPKEEVLRKKLKVLTLKYLFSDIKTESIKNQK